MLPTKVANATEMKDLIADSVAFGVTSPKAAREVIKMLDPKGINIIEVVEPYCERMLGKDIHLVAVYMKIKETKQPNEFIMKISAEAYGFLQMLDEYSNRKG